MKKRKNKATRSGRTGPIVPAAREISRRDSMPPSSPAESAAHLAARSRASRAELLIPLAIAALALLAYSNSFSGPFIIDDRTSIPENPHIRSLWPISTVLTLPTNAVIKRRPVVGVSLAINYAVSGPDVWSYHAFNVLVHVLNAFLVYGICRRTLRSEALRARYGRAAPWLSAAVALLWVVHPLQTEAVTYIIQRTELLMAFFLLSTLYCVIRGAGCSALGMGSKEVMAMAPLVVLLYDRTFLAGSFREALRRRAAPYVGLAAGWPIIAFLIAIRPSEVVGFSFKHLTPWDYARTQFGVIVHYLELAVWPHPLVIDYGGWPVAESLAAVLPEAAVVLTLVGASAWALVRRSPAGLLGAWFFLILAPTSSVLPIRTEIAAERRMYLPLAAVIVLVVIGVHEGLRRVVQRDALRRAVAASTVVALLATFCAATRSRNEDYRTEVSILSDLLAKRPAHPWAHYNLGFLFEEAGQLAEAIRHYAEAVRVNPGLARAHRRLEMALMKQGQLQPAAADVQTHRGQALVAWGDFDKGIAPLSLSVRILPRPRPDLDGAGSLARESRPAGGSDHALRRGGEAESEICRDAQPAGDGASPPGPARSGGRP